MGDWSRLICEHARVMDFDHIMAQFRDSTETIYSTLREVQIIV
jgi:hypothetical protein